ncbi:MAG: hypothetical protein AB7N76_22145 [Planctomycetota bacterium]
MSTGASAASQTALTPDLRDAIARGGQTARAAFGAAWRGEGRVDRDPGAGDPSLRRADLADELLRWLWEQAPPCEEPGAALVALGGYGRGRLYPGSDLDLLLLRGDAPRGDPEAFLRHLWDLGVEVGHATRSLAKVSEVLRRDLPSATAMLEGRLIAGDPAAFAALQDEAARFVREERQRFGAAKLAEAEERYARHGGGALLPGAATGPRAGLDPGHSAAVCLLVPDLKHGRGQARDLELARLLAALWVERPEELPRDPARVLPWLDAALPAWLELDAAGRTALAQAEARLRAAREALHALAPGRGDRLEVPLQGPLAIRLGYADRGGRLALEVALEEIYRAAKHVDRLLRRCRLRLLPPPPPALRQPLAPGVAAIGDEVVLDPLPPSGPALLELFRQAQRTQRAIPLHTLEAARQGVGALQLDPAALQSFRELLAGGRGVARVLADMHEAGVLGVFLPEFAALECLAQADPYHAYTVDEHTLAALRALEGEAPHPGREPSREREDRVREELFLRARSRELLRLGVLLHDSGKAGGSLGHDERGAALVPGVARRLGLSPGEERHVAFLVRHDATLSRMADERDVDAPDTVTRLLELVEGDPLRLEHLYLLTCADVAAVAPGALTRWKDSLLTRLYERAAQALEGAAPPPTPDTVEGWLAALAGRVDPVRLRAHLERCAPGYLAEVSEGELLLHLELLDELTGEPPLALRWTSVAGIERVWIVTKDRPGLLARLCGALSGAGLDILGLSTSERLDEDGALVLDRFALRAGRGAPPPEQREARLREVVGGVLAGALDPEALLAERARREPPSSTGPTPVPVRIRARDEPGYTLVDVSAPDRVGLLHDLTLAISAADLDIALAKVATRGDRAVDVFHVTAPGGGPIPAARREPLLRALERAARGGPT